MVKRLSAMQETQVRSLGWEDPLEKEMETHSSQYPCLENLMDKEAWWAAVHRVAKNQTRLSDFTSLTSLSFLTNLTLSPLPINAEM